MALGPHQIPFINEDKVNSAERAVDKKLSDQEWLNSAVEQDGAKRHYWTVYVVGSFSELERGTLCQKYRDVGWGYVTTRDHDSIGFNLELCEKEVAQ